MRSTGYRPLRNFPSSWKAIKLTYVKDKILAWDDASNSYKTLVDGKVSKSISISAKGKKVKTIKVTFSGSKVKNTNICLKDSNGDVYSETYPQANLYYKRPL